MRSLLSIATLVLLSLPTTGQTVTVSDASPDFLNGTYTYTGEVGGHNRYANIGNEIWWDGSQWRINMIGASSHYDFYNPNDCGAQAPDEGWLVSNGISRPILSGDVCDVKVVYVSGAGNAALNGDYVYTGITLEKNEYVAPSPAAPADDPRVVWSGTQWRINNPYMQYYNTGSCGPEPPGNLWQEGGSTGSPTLSGDICGQLPVELIALSAIIRGSDVHIIWETLSESGNAGFEVHEAVVQGVETPRANLDWKKIGFVDGKGDAIDRNTYSFEVASRAPGTYRYRLAQIDTDGGISLSKELEVTIEVPLEFYMAPAYPNPFNPTTIIRFAVREAQEVSLALYDAAGRLIQVVFDEAIGSHDLQEVRVDGTDLPSGIYLVRMKGEKFETSQQISLVR